MSSVAMSRFGPPIWHSGAGKKGRAKSVWGEKTELVMGIPQISAPGAVNLHLHDRFAFRSVGPDRVLTVDPDGFRIDGAAAQRADAGPSSDAAIR
jgi:hypothetical protein